MTKYTVEESGNFYRGEEGVFNGINVYLWRHLQALCLSKCKACLTG